MLAASRHSVARKNLPSCMRGGWIDYGKCGTDCSSGASE